MSRGRRPRPRSSDLMTSSTACGGSPTAFVPSTLAAFSSLAAWSDAVTWRKVASSSGVRMPSRTSDALTASAMLTPVADVCKMKTSNGSGSSIVDA